jgi:hypothetical protein
MTKRALFAGAGFLGLCFSLSAQEAPSLGPIQPGLFTLNQLGQSGVVGARSALRQTDFLLSSAYGGLPSLMLANRQLFYFPSAFAWMEATPTAFLPPFTAMEPARVRPATAFARDSGDKAVDLRPDSSYAFGEVSVFYGRSTGKFGGEVKQGYILGGVGNDKTQITVGASYGQASGRVPVPVGH